MNDFIEQKKRVERFLNVFLPPTFLGWNFCDETQNADVYIFQRKSPYGKIRMKIHFVLEGKFTGNPPNYHMPSTILTVKEMMDWLTVSGVCFLVIKCRGIVEFPQLYYIDKYANIPKEELEGKSRHDKRIDTIQVHSHTWYDKRFHPVGKGCSNLIRDIETLLK